ncbi:choline ABC transporter substrate-binding protein [Mesorhizobium shangrilense]|uniref:Choline ABC transporter substrate-binding protein n=1 Tax=Mesorhizobium shangrilense TaxID=460060 RepID=A0ABV2D8U1_9HYPH
MRRLVATIIVACSMGFASPLLAADQESCKALRLSDLGWTDIALTNATVSAIADALGYHPEQNLLGLNVTYEMLKAGNIDAFLGNWRPAQDDEFKSYFDDGSVVPVGTNLVGAKYTLAVPTYVADAGVRSFDDLAAHADKFGGKIYGIEPGTNKPLLDMVAADRHGLKPWEIVESSEAAMLAQVQRSIPKKDWIVFLGWQPHPMNTHFDMTYLTGGDVEFGPNFGGATVRTIVRRDYPANCPNLTRLLSNIAFDIDYENAGMDMIMNQGKTADEAARAMMAGHPQMLQKWLDGVTTFDGSPALPVVQAAIGK